MPELPEVETVRRGLEPHVTGALIKSVELRRPDLRFPFPKDMVSRIEGRRIMRIGRRAKYLLFKIEGGDTLLSHLGMTGNYRFDDKPLMEPTRYHEVFQPGVHDHVLVHLTTPNGTPMTMIYSDPRRFGFMDLFKETAECTYLNTLGPEPLGNELSGAHLARRFEGKRAPVKSALLDQRNVAGLGNIYVCEALWRARISPLTPVGRLVEADGGPRPELEALVTAIRQVLTAAVTAGGSTLKDFKNAEGGAGYFQHVFDVYDREGEPCRRSGCSGQVARIIQSGRSSFYCPSCQPEIS